MKGVKITARQNIIDSKTNKLHNDQGLKTLDGYFESELYVVEDPYDKDLLIDEFKKMHPEIKADTYEVFEQKV